MINFESHKRRKLKKGSSLANSQGQKSLNNSNSNTNLIQSPGRGGKGAGLNSSSLHLDVQEARGFDEDSLQLSQQSLLKKEQLPSHRTLATGRVSEAELVRKALEYELRPASKLRLTVAAEGSFPVARLSQQNVQQFDKEIRLVHESKLRREREELVVDVQQKHMHHSVIMD